MAVRKITVDQFEVDSSSSGSVYTIRWGIDGGSWYSCTCMAYIMKANRSARDFGTRHVTCKHTDQVYALHPHSPASSPSTGGTMKKYLEYHGGNSHKFWEIDMAPGATSYTVRWGRTGTTGQSQVKHFANATIAQGQYDKIVDEKLNKGYQWLATAVHPAAAPITATVQRGGPAGTPAHIATAKLGTPMPAFSPPAPKLLPMLAQEVEMDTIAAYAGDDRYVFEAKLDGQRVMIKIENGKATAIGRNGQSSQHNARFQGGKHKVDLDRLGSRTLVLDGELMMETGVFWIFDMPRFVGGSGMVFDLTESWEIRHKALELVFAAWQPDPSCYRLLPVARTTEDKVALVESQRANQGEGVIIKMTNAPYKPGIRCLDTMKAKFVHDADLIVTKVGVDGKNNACLSVFKGGGLVEVGKCSLNGKATVQVGDVVVVRYLYLGAGDRIVQPRLMNVRTDKPHIQCTFDQLIGTNKKVVS